MLTRWGGFVLGAVLAFVAALGVACGHGGNAATSADSGTGALDGSTVDGSNLFGGDAAQVLTIQPQNQTLTVTGPGVTEQFHAYLNGSTTPVAAQFSVDQCGHRDHRRHGLFIATGLLGGQVERDGQVGTLQAQTVLTVVLAARGQPRQRQRRHADSSCRAAARRTRAFAWLYPYNGTVFPRGLAPPVLQFGGTAPDATLRARVLRTFDYKGFYGASNPGQVTLSPAALGRRSPRRRRRTDTVKVQVTKISGGRSRGPITETWTHRAGQPQGHRLLQVALLARPRDGGATHAHQAGRRAARRAPRRRPAPCATASAPTGRPSWRARHRARAPSRAPRYDLKSDASTSSLRRRRDATLRGALPGRQHPHVARDGRSSTTRHRGNDRAQALAPLRHPRPGRRSPAPGWDGVVTNA